jgi:hypothetical protein
MCFGIFFIINRVVPREADFVGILGAGVDASATGLL